MDDSLDFMQGMNTRQFLLSTIRGLLPSLLINIACTLIIYNLLSPHFPCAGYERRRQKYQSADERKEFASHQKVCPMLKKTLKWLACLGSKTVFVTPLTTVVVWPGNAGGLRLYPKSKRTGPTGVL